MIARKGASFSIKSSIFSEISKTITTSNIKVIEKKNVPKNFLMGYSIFVNEDIADAVKCIAAIQESLKGRVDLRVIGWRKGYSDWFAE